MKRHIAVVLAVMALQGFSAAPLGTAIAVEPTPQEYAKRLAMGLWGLPEWRCLRELWHRESRWNHKADNPRSTAYGIPQILGLNRELTANEQVDAGIRYVEHRYSTPCAALRFHNRRGWY